MSCIAILQLTPAVSGTGAHHGLRKSTIEFGLMSLQPPGKGAKMAAYVNYRMRLTMSDGRVIIGTFMAYDKFMNVILADSEEFRKVASALRWFIHRGNMQPRSKQRRPGRWSARSDGRWASFCCAARMSSPSQSRGHRRRMFVNLAFTNDDDPHCGVFDLTVNVCAGQESEGAQCGSRPRPWTCGRQRHRTAHWRSSSRYAVQVSSNEVTGAWFFFFFFV